jgi:hypothetical protein
MILCWCNVHLTCIMEQFYEFIETFVWNLCSSKWRISSSFCCRIFTRWRKLIWRPLASLQFLHLRHADEGSAKGGQWTTFCKTVICLLPLSLSTCRKPCWALGRDCRGCMQVWAAMYTTRNGTHTTWIGSKFMFVTRTEIPSKLAQAVTLRTCILKVPGSCLGRDTGLSSLMFSWFSWVPAGRCWNRNASVHIHSNLLFISHPTIRRYNRLGYWQRR